MSTKSHTAVIDGEKYFIERVNPFDGLRLTTMCGRSFGPLVSSIATSPNLKALAGSLAGVFSQDEDGAAKLETLLDQDILALASVLGVTIEQVAESLGTEDLVRIVKLALIGHVATPAGGVDRLSIEDESTYFDVMGPRIAKHSAMHQLKLIWEALRFNMGPTSAGDPTSPQGASPAQS